MPGVAAFGIQSVSIVSPYGKFSSKVHMYPHILVCILFDFRKIGNRFLIVFFQTSLLLCSHFHHLAPSVVTSNPFPPTKAPPFPISPFTSPVSSTVLSSTPLATVVPLWFPGFCSLSDLSTIPGDLEPGARDEKGRAVLEEDF